MKLYIQMRASIITAVQVRKYDCVEWLLSKLGGRVCVRRINVCVYITNTKSEICAGSSY